MGMDIPLAAVLMSAFCGLNEQEMAVIRSSEAFESAEAL